MGLNDEVDAEFGTGENRTAIINTAVKDRESANDVPDSAIFTKGIESRRLPELDAEFVLQKSREDRLVELAERSSEIQQSGGISRADVIAIESIVEDLEGNDNLAPEGNDPPRRTPETDEGDESVDEPPTRRQPLGNPNLYTEERSKTEFKPALTLMRTSYEKAYADLVATTIDLGNRLLVKADEEIQDKRLAYVDINVQFNKNIINFLDEYGSTDLTDVKCSFTRYLKWVDLTGIPLTFLRPHLISYPDDKLRAEAMVSDFEGTKTGEFIEELSKLFRQDSIFRAIQEFTGSNLNRLISSSRLLSIDIETGEIKPWKDPDNGLVSFDYSNTLTIGGIFSFIGTDKLKTIIETRIRGFDYCKQVIKTSLAAIAELEVGEQSNLKEKLDSLIELSGKINEMKLHMTAMLAEIGAVFAVYEVINNYMLDMS